MYGDTQFTEGDIVTDSRPTASENVDVDVVREEEKTLRELVAEGKVIRRRKEEEDPELGEQKDPPDEGEGDRLDLAILAARQRHDSTLLISLLENKLNYLVRLPWHAHDSHETQPFHRNIIQQPSRYVEFAYLHTQIPRYLLGAGTPAARNVGFAAWDPQSFVRFASGSQGLGI